MKASDWISVKDRLPKGSNSLLVVVRYNDDEWIEFADYTDGEWYDCHDNILLGVTHWQPIVFPKKEKL